MDTHTQPPKKTSPSPKMVLGTILSALFLCVILSSGKEFPLGAHFSSQIRKPATTETKVKVQKTKKRTPLLRKRALVKRTESVAQHTTPSPVTSGVHRAAPAQEPPTTADSLLFIRTIHPVSQVPDWGAMRSSKEWSRSYDDMHNDAFVRVPSYDLSSLTIPIKTLLKDRNSLQTIKLLTAKLYYSTRYFGAYNIDAGEFSAIHPGIDLKLPEGTPIGAIAGGRVHAIRNNPESLGLHVIIEHDAPDGKTYYSIYGHMEYVLVDEKDIVTPGQTVGTVGMSGNTSGAHLHLQIDRGTGAVTHTPYWPATMPSRAEANKHTVNPIEFIAEFEDRR